ncbi:hypothetical protein V8B97DRAFT_1876342, partial [Scleroderma yunnanense]
WTSPNHKAFVAMFVHLEHEGKPLSMLLDFIELAESHSGVNLAKALVKVLDEFGISDKTEEHKALHQIMGGIDKDEVLTLAKMGAGDPDGVDNDDARWVDGLDNIMPKLSRKYTQSEWDW